MKVKSDFRVRCVTELDVQWCKDNCVEFLLLDLDGTLRAENAKEFKKKIVCWVQCLKEAGIQLCIVSNAKRKKVKKAAKMLDIPYIADAEKPSSLGIKEAMTSWNYNPDTTIMIGDSKCDIVSGFCAGLRTVLVDEIVDKCECGCGEDYSHHEWWEI